MAVTVAVVQAEPAVAPEDPIERTRALATDAARQGAQLIAFPETWIPGYPAWLDVCRDAALWEHPPVQEAYAAMARASIDVGGAGGRALAAIARDLGVTLAVGVVERVPRGPGMGTLYNSLLLFTPDGTLRTHHRKLVPTYTERLVWGPGDADGLRTVETPAGRVGGLICWEHWMPLTRQVLHEEGEEIHLALWPTAHERLLLASRHYAFEGRCFVLACASLLRARYLPPNLDPHPDRVLDPEAWVVRGGSAIIGPDAGYVAEPVYDTPTTLVAELDLDACRREHMTLDVAGHYARPDLFALTVRRDTRRTSS